MVKFWICKTPRFKLSEGEVKEIDNLFELCKFIKTIPQEKLSLSISKNWLREWVKKGYITDKCVEELKKSGALSCEWMIEIYDDYRE